MQKTKHKTNDSHKIVSPPIWRKEIHHAIHKKCVECLEGVIETLSFNHWFILSMVNDVLISPDHIFLYYVS